MLKWLFHNNKIILTIIIGEYYGSVSKSDDISFDKITYIDKDCSDIPYLNAIEDTVSQQILSAINQNRLDDVLLNPNGSGIFDRIERAEIFAKMAYFKN